ncbi:UPF0283 membrane protein like [Actinidia chinensis var. chinensis]|uniref:UPF0283 membrane protein like n=1 Tax=Actinidia chinensis var. chinensis TaxID=1590841 RepID=A0A2R6RVA3_ACTCC|nr:UPF0283 membrane protein like [Actinidia chinensis var. chinensis]
MQVASKACRLTRVLQPRSILLYSDRRFDTPLAEAPHSSLQHRNHSTLWFSGTVHDSCGPSALNDAPRILQSQMCSMMMMAMGPKVLYSTGAITAEDNPTDAVKELYNKILKSIEEQRTMAPNAWLWSLIENCANHDDIKLLFDILHRLRVFRLSNLRIHANFNCNLCREITKACARVGAIDFGKKTLWKHNVYGLSPSIGSAHHLLLYAKEHNDAKLMVEIMKLLKSNDLPMQPGTADIVFSICYNTDNWELLSKYSKRFIKAGVKLRQTSFDVWMEFAAKKGDVDSLWKVEKLRSECMKQHTLSSGFSCVKGFLLEHKPEDATAIIQVLIQTLSDAKKPGIMVELQKLVSEWTLEVIKHQKDEDRKALAAGLQNDIPAMVNYLLKLGLEVNVNMEDLTNKEGLLC